MKGGAKQARLEPTRSNIGLDRQYAELGGGNQNNHREAIGRYCPEYKVFHDLLIHYSITLSVPDMSSCSSPQKTSQKKVKVPTLSGTNRILWTMPGWISAL